MAKEDLLLQSKHADVALDGPHDSGWSLWFFGQPEAGKCLSVEYVPGNYPGLTVIVRTTERATEAIGEAKESGWYERDVLW